MKFCTFGEKYHYCLFSRVSQNIFDEKSLDFFVIDNAKSLAKQNVDF